MVFRKQLPKLADTAQDRGRNGNSSTMANRSDEPAYRKIQNAIRRRIDSGQLKPGNAVPSERELARIHGVSLMTARHALTELARDGLVERRHGAGTFVAPPKVHFNKLLGYTEQMASLGPVSYTHLDVYKRQPPTHHDCAGHK